MELLALESIVTTQLKTRITRQLGSLYPNLSFTSEVSEKTPSFPNVYVHELEPSEVGMSIPNQTIHAIRDTIQIDVSTNTSKADARKVANAVVNTMKLLQYTIVAMPTYMKDNNLHRYVIRARRVIANGDTFN